MKKRVNKNPGTRLRKFSDFLDLESLESLQDFIHSEKLKIFQFINIMRLLFYVCAFINVINLHSFNVNLRLQTLSLCIGAFLCW